MTWWLVLLLVVLMALFLIYLKLKKLMVPLSSL